MSKRLLPALLMLLPFLAPMTLAAQESPRLPRLETRTEMRDSAAKQASIRQLLYEREARLAREREMRIQVRKKLGISLARPNRGPIGTPLGPSMVGPYPRLVWARPVIVFEAPPVPRRSRN